MKFGYFIPALVIVLNIISCSTKTSKDPQPVNTQNIISAKKWNQTILEVTYDASGNPVIIKRADGKLTMKIDYEKNLIKTIEVDYRDIVKYNVNYINANEVAIETNISPLPSAKWLKKATLKFNARGLVENSKWETQYLEGANNYRYNSNDNLIYSEYVSQGERVGQPIIYQDYDDKPNPFFAKAKLWGIINMVEPLYTGTYLAFPICRNNPLKILMENNIVEEKLAYTYDTNSYPTEITEYLYFGTAGVPGKESDFKKYEEALKLTYTK